MFIDMSRPQFIVFVGPQFSEKTAKLLLCIDKYKHQRKTIVGFVPAHEDAISSHTGLSMSAVSVESGVDVLKELDALDKMPDIVAVDKAHLIDGVTESLVWLFRSGVTVLVSALDLSATFKPFKETQRALTWATRVEKCVAACDVCGEDAYYTHKCTDDNDDIVTGGRSTYSPRCAKCHPLFTLDEER